MSFDLRQFPEIRRYLFLLSFIFLFPICISSASEPIEYRAEAYRTFQSIEIDGDFNETDWQHAKLINQFVQTEPDEGVPITESTAVRILYDEKNIYFGFTCSSSWRDSIVANEMRRDAENLRENDNVFILLDTYNDKRNGVFFRINPLGAMQDIALTNSGDSQNRSWDAVWDCRSKINDDHWTTEIAIPFSQLRFNRSESMVWGINFGRTIRQKNEEATWVPVSRQYGSRSKYRTANLGSLVGLAGITPSRRLEVLPYVLPGVSRIEGEEGTDGVFDIGLDLKYGLTSNLTADLTLNTDFAQVEADQEQVNLTRFSLYFPEKRPFFLEGAGLFDFGIPRPSFFSPPPLILFYSRRIGLEEGYAIPILGGGKITGKMGPYGIGLLNVLTDEFHTDPSVTDEDDIVDLSRTNYSVLRVTRDLFSGSSIGAIAINKQDTDTYNRAGGLDFAYRPNDSIDVRGLWARTYEEEVSGKNDAMYFGGTWRNSLLRFNGTYTFIGEDFNPEVGFVRRQGSRRFRGQMRFTPWPRKFGVRRIFMGPEVDYILNQDDELETREFSLTNWFQLEQGSWINVEIRRTSEFLDEDFEIREGVIIPVDDYNLTTLRTMIDTDEGRKISGRFGANYGTFFNGTNRGFDIQANFKPSGRLAFETQYQFNRVNLPSEDPFNVNIFGSRIVYSFTTTLFAKLFAQWNSDDELISANFLLNYIYRPGSDFYLVFNRIYDSGSAKTTPGESTVVAKMTYWWNP
ncbi:carbohydrate binding family 9 domain-containing protein [Candidatus Poribacteria bacterium]|nr:carbohydrate binding family 9 domain-containing protein [Candidatus Poribacteria bacterium]